MTPRRAAVALFDPALGVAARFAHAFRSRRFPSSVAGVSVGLWSLAVRRATR